MGASVGSVVDGPAQGAERRLIFTITTGRSGTQLLQCMGALLEGVASVHEPEPKYSHVLRRVQQEPMFAREWLEAVKLPAIATYREPVYFETSHLFGKGFLEPMLELGLVPDLVVLRREARAVATSLYTLGTIPARTEGGRRFLLQPDDPGVLTLPGWPELHDYQLCWWYCLEMERRAVHYAERLTALGARVVAMTFPELLDGGFSRVVTELGLDQCRGFDFASRLAETQRARVNDKLELKEREARVLPDDLDHLEAEVRARLGAPADRTSP